MKQQLNRILSALMILALYAGLFVGTGIPTSAAETSGKCGSNLEWSFADGRLTITGSGDMTDYNQIDMPPWYEFRAEIFYLSLPDGMTSVGNMAFYDCYNLTAISVPASVTDIGKMAFCQCRNVKILNLRDGLLSIGRSAFEQCDGIQDLRLPNTVTTLGYHAFYNCAGLRYVTIPASVTQMDDGVFAYCRNLVRAEVDAGLETIPAWTFYGCDQLSSITLTEQTTTTETNAFTGCGSLNTVYYPGTEENAEQIRNQIAADEESFGHFGVITDDVSGSDISSSSTTVGDSGEVTVSNTTVSKTEGATVTTTTNTTTEENSKTATTEVTATVVTEEGWQTLIDAILAAQKEQEKKESEGMETGKVEVDVYVTEDSGVPTDVLDTVAGSNVNMTVQTGDGSKFSVHGSTLETSTEEEKVHFSYSATRMANPDFAELNGTAAYKLQFSHSSAMKVEVLIRVPTEHARKTATLYQANNGKLTLLQSVVIDTMGYAHFYLANVDAETDYRIGIEVPDIDKNTVIVPEELHAEYGVTDTYYFASDMYVITGRTSAWGVSMTQVTLILMAVMVVSAVAVGIFMYLRNKKKLRDGYVPDISEEDWEE